MHNGLHARSNVHLSHVFQSEEDREFLGVEENQLKVRMSSRKGRNMKDKTTGKKRLYMAVQTDNGNEQQWVTKAVEGSQFKGDTNHANSRPSSLNNNPC